MMFLSRENFFRDVGLLLLFFSSVTEKAHKGLRSDVWLSIKKMLKSFNMLRNSQVAFTVSNQGIISFELH